MHSIRIHTTKHKLAAQFFLLLTLLGVIHISIEMVEKLDGRVGMHSVERVRYVLNNLVIVKYGVNSLVVCISTCLWFVQILMLLMKQLILFHADSCNK